MFQEHIKHFNDMMKEVAEGMDVKIPKFESHLPESLLKDLTPTERDMMTQLSILGVKMDWMIGEWVKHSQRSNEEFKLLKKMGDKLRHVEKDVVEKFTDIKKDVHDISQRVSSVEKSRAFIARLIKSPVTWTAAFAVMTFFSTGGTEKLSALIEVIAKVAGP